MHLNKLVTIPKAYQDFNVTFEDGTEFDIQSAIKSSGHLAPIIFMQAMHLASHHDANLCLKAVFKCSHENPLPLTLYECQYTYNFKFQKDVADKYLSLATTHFFEYLFPKGISPSQASKNLEYFLSGYVDFFNRTYSDAEIVTDTSFICTLYKGFRPIYQNAVLINSKNDEDSNNKKRRRSAKKTPTNMGKKRTGDKDLNNKFDANSPLSRENFQLCEKVLKQPAYDLSQLIERLRFLKKTEYKSNKIDEKALLAALALSPSMQIKLKRCFGVNNDLIFPSEVINLLGKVERSVDLRLTGSGEDDGKSWFESGKKDIKADDLSVPIVRFLLQSVTLKDDIFTLDETLIMRAWDKLRLSDENAKTETSLLDRFYNKNKEINRRENRRAALKGIRKGLDDEIIGMDDAKNALVNIVRDKLEGRPLDQQGPIFIYGASGVGKTSLAKSLVNSLNHYFENNYVLQVFNMELFQREGAEMRLFGSGHQYNIANLGMLTSASEFKPKRVIVFDEIEKAHSNTILSLLSLLSDFKGHDNSSLREVDFSQCIFIFTSNLGQETCNSEMANQLDFRTVLASAFPPEFVNRISRGYLSYCPSLSESELEQFLTLQAEKLAKQINLGGNGISLLPVRIDIALAVLSEELTPRAIMGQVSKIQALLANKMDDIEHDGVIILISIELWKNISLTDFIRDYRSSIWIAKSRFDESHLVDNDSIVLHIYEPKLAIRKEDLQLLNESRYVRQR